MNKLPHIRRVSAFAFILLISLPLYPQTLPDNKEQSDSLQRSKILDEVIVNGTGSKGRDKIGHMSISGAEINSRPALLGEHDVIKALQTTSGVVSGTEGFAGLYVRGGETDQNLYLLDGLPLLNVYHFGGLFSTFSTHSIDRVDFYKGAFPSLFAERASSIVDVALKRPDYNKTAGTFSVGLISGQLYFSTPLKKGNSALSVALRRTWFDVFSVPALAIINSTKKSDGRKNIFHYNFTDMIVKLSQVLANMINQDIQGWQPDGVFGYPFSDKGIEGELYTITVSEVLQTPLVSMIEKLPRRVNLYSISRPYFEYMVSVLAMDYDESALKGNLLSLGLMEPTKIYSNIEGGAGLMGSYNLSTKRVELLQLTGGWHKK